jgi:hypothetical protein
VQMMRCFGDADGAGDTRRTFRAACPSEEDAGCALVSRASLRASGSCWSTPDPSIARARPLRTERKSSGGGARKRGSGASVPDPDLRRHWSRSFLLEEKKQLRGEGSWFLSGFLVREAHITMMPAHILFTSSGPAAPLSPALYPQKEWCPPCGGLVQIPCRLPPRCPQHEKTPHARAPRRRPLGRRAHKHRLWRARREASRAPQRQDSPRTRPRRRPLGRRAHKHRLWRARRESLRCWATKRLPTHPPEPGYPCCISALGELAWMAPRGEPTSTLAVSTVRAGHHGWMDP